MKRVLINIWDRNGKHIYEGDGEQRFTFIGFRAGLFAIDVENFSTLFPLDVIGKIETKEYSE